MREAVARYIICGPDGLPPDGDLLFFLEVSDRAGPVKPGTALLERLSDPGFRVRPISERPPAIEPVRLVPREARESGSIVRVGAVIWVDDLHARVEGGFHVAPLHAAGSIYTLERIDRQWHVVRAELRWIS